MRMLTRNKQTIKYAELTGGEPVYELDENGDKIVDYVDDEGVTHYRVTGEERYIYEEPKIAKVNIAFSGGEVSEVEFGVNDSAYDATLVYLLDEYPITETCLIWFQSEPTHYTNEDSEERVNPDSADYKVVMVKPSLNQTKVLLGKRIKSADLNQAP